MSAIARRRRSQRSVATIPKSVTRCWPPSRTRTRVFGCAARAWRGRAHAARTVEPLAGLLSDKDADARAAAAEALGEIHRSRWARTWARLQA